MNSKVSIIIPIYNAEEYLEECLKSVINQTYKNLEIILINDGSKDNSKYICEKFLKKDSRIILYNQENSGVSKTRNFGIEKSTGKYICFIDSDDVLQKCFVENLYYNLVKCNAQCSICKHTIIYNEINIQEENNIQCYEKEEATIRLFGEFGGFLVNKLYIKDIIEKNDLKLKENIHISEDLIFNIEYFDCCDRVVSNDKKMYYYRIHELSAVNNYQNIKWFSVLDTYEYLLEYSAIKNTNLKNKVLFNLAQLIGEANFRIKKNNLSDNLIKKKIEKFKKIIKEENNFTIRQKIKIFIFNNLFYIIVLYRKQKYLRR